MKTLESSSLDRNEHGILRLIATGVTKRVHYHDADVVRLSELALIEEQNGGLGLTEQGKLTLEEERKGPARTERPGRNSPDPSREADHRKVAERCDALRLDQPQTMTSCKSFRFKHVIDEICAFPWASLTSEEMADVAGAYYFFSIQFRECVAEARRLYPADADLRRLEAEECATDNLSPWPGVAAAGERMDHDEFIRRTLALKPRAATEIAASDAIGQRYLAATRAQASEVRAACLASYEDGGLERIFRSMLQFPQWDDTALLQAFRHFLSEHVRFDAGSEGSHGALCRHIPFDDRILPLWQGFRDLLMETVPAISRIS